MRSTHDGAHFVSPGFRHDAPGRPAAAWNGVADRSTSVHLADLAPIERAVVVAPHPDDESLGAGGLIAGLSACGVDVQVVVCSDGGAATVELPSGWSDLVACRSAEVEAAVRTLGAGRARLTLLGLPDGELSGRLDDLTRTLEPVLTGADLVVSPWPGDGHPDHHAVGAAVRTIVSDDAMLLEYPVWFWHWGDPDAAQHLARAEGRSWVSMPMPASTRAIKAAAIAEHRSQVTGDRPMLTKAVLQHWQRDEELFLWRGDPPARADRSGSEFFEMLYRSTPGGDPWSFAAEAEEQARFDHLASVVGERKVGRCLEVGCSTGELTRRLVSLTRYLVALDVAPAAVETTRSVLERAGGSTGVDRSVEVRAGRVPEDLQEEDDDFDLIVVSEVGYYFDVDGLLELTRELHGRAAGGSRILACHWTGSSEDHRLSAHQVHTVLGGELVRLGWASGASSEFGRHRIDVWERRHPSSEAP